MTTGKQVKFTRCLEEMMPMGGGQVPRGGGDIDRQGLQEQRCRGLKSRRIVLREAGTSCMRGHKGERAAFHVARGGGEGLVRCVSEFL